MEVTVLDDRKAMGNAAGKAVEDKILELLDQQEEIRMLFAAAPSQKDFFGYLCQSSKIPWDRITAFHMDEYLGLTPDAPQLFSNFLKRYLFNKVRFKKVHFIEGSRDSNVECRRYAALLSEKPIDIICLGIGENGHIAFNDPPVADFNDPEAIKVVELDQICRQQQVNDGCFHSLDQVPSKAVTLTIPTLLEGQFLFCMVPGANKREAVFNALNGPITTACPASVLQMHSKCEIYLDVESYGNNNGSFDHTSSQERLVEGINCISNQSQKVEIRNGKIENISRADRDDKELSYVGPGLIDLQVNGVHGVDFNDVSLSQNDVLVATRYLLHTGVTTYFPAVITNSDENILQILTTIRQACEAYPLVNSCIGGIHLEGPFISKTEGPRGAHNEKYIKKPDWNLVNSFQKASGGRIKLLTLAPEWEGSLEFIQKCREQGILVGMGHSDATPEQIRSALKAGITLSTHLGNGVALMLPRHPNLLWEQLAQDDLFASIIADGFHLSDSFLKVTIRTKGDKVLLISDVTCFSGRAPGVYQTHIGEEVVLKKEGKLALKAHPDLLAGATKTLLEDIQYLAKQAIVPLGTAWKMGSVHAARFLGNEAYGLDDGQQADLVEFQVKDSIIHINKVIKRGQVVFENTIFDKRILA